MKETNFEEWIVWAKSTNNLDVANVEPIIYLFLEETEEERNSLFLGNVWNGSNWHNVSNSYHNMLEFVFLQNPPRYTYPALLGLSIKEMKRRDQQSEVAKYMANSDDDDVVTLADLISSREEK